MIILWIAALLVMGAAAALIVRFSSRPAAAGADPARAVYLRQIAEIDDLAARDLLAEDERKSAHAEASRRLLAEDEAVPETEPAKAGWLAVLATVAAVGVLALGAYLVVGSPASPGQPFASRIKGWLNADPTTLNPAELAALLKEVMKNGREDASGLFLLGQTQETIGDPLSAQRSLERSVAMEPGRASAWELLGVVRSEVAEGKVTPKAREAFDRALQIDPKLMVARFYVGQSEIAAGRRAEGVAMLRDLLDEVPAGGREMLEREIAAAEGRPAPAGAGVAGDPAIRQMVDGLARRLKDNPEDPTGWSRLIRSYTVLGDTAAADRARADAARAYKDRPAALAKIEADARVQSPPPGRR